MRRYPDFGYDLSLSDRVKINPCSPDDACAAGTLEELKIKLAGKNRERPLIVAKFILGIGYAEHTRLLDEFKLAPEHFAGEMRIDGKKRQIGAHTMWEPDDNTLRVCAWVGQPGKKMADGPDRWEARKVALLTTARLLAVPPAALSAES
jgi:hypothetical protein